MSDYTVILSDMRTSRKKGLRYAKVRAVANGLDSFKSVFTSKARQRVIDQLKSNGVKTNALHKNAIDDNLNIYLKDRLAKATVEEKDTLDALIGNLQNRDFPIGRVVDAKFIDDKTIEAEIVENDALKLLGTEQADYLDATWNMVEGGILGGVSLVFNDVESFTSGDKLFIDDVNVLGLDFVDRPSHTDTRVLETFTRAAQQSIEENKLTNEEPNKTPVEPKSEDSAPNAQALVDEVTKKVTQEVKEELSRKEEDAKKTQEVLDAENKIAEAEAKTAEAERIAKEAISLGEQALKQKEEAIAKVDNPFAEQARQAIEAGKDPLEGKSFGELMALKDNA